MGNDKVFSISTLKRAVSCATLLIATHEPPCLRTRASLTTPCESVTPRVVIDSGEGLHMGIENLLSSLSKASSRYF